jgi:hypothetical protein
MAARSRPQRRIAVTRVAAVLLTWIAAFGGVGCSSSSTTCDPSHCLPGNQCIDDGDGRPQCRLVCASQNDCPENYHCTPTSTGNVDFCAADRTAYKPGPGTWGASCTPSGGIDANPDCDSSQNFACYAQSPTDGNAYCSVYQCASDADCRGGWWCATVNEAPNATRATRTTGSTVTVCQPRTYCAPCTSDVDCWSPTGSSEKCIPDINGQSYCTPVCVSDSNCPIEASCLALDQGGAAVVAEYSTPPATAILRSNTVRLGSPVDVPRHISAGSVNVEGRAYPGTGEALTFQVRLNTAAIAGAQVRFDSTQLSLHDIAIPGLAGLALHPGDRLDCAITYTPGVEPAHPPYPIPTDGLVGGQVTVKVNATLDAAQAGLCVPRAGTCVGDGALCSPCRSDADCPAGVCARATSSTEHFCTVASSVPCTSGSSISSQCPATDEANVPVACTLSAQGDLPASQCVGTVINGLDPSTGGPAYVAGCYTPNR